MPQNRIKLWLIAYTYLFIQTTIFEDTCKECHDVHTRITQFTQQFNRSIHLRVQQKTAPMDRIRRTPILRIRFSGLKRRFLLFLSHNNRCRSRPACTRHVVKSYETVTMLRISEKLEKVVSMCYCDDYSVIRNMNSNLFGILIKISLLLDVTCEWFLQYFELIY